MPNFYCWFTGPFFARCCKNNVMRKLIAFLFLATAGHAYAQNTTTSNTPARTGYGVQWGLKAGVNLANFESSIYPNSTNRTSFHAGGLAHIHLSPKFAVQPELVYSVQGFKQKISSGYELDFKADYINIPVLVQYMVRGARIQTGPQVGFLLSAKGDYTDGTFDDVKDNMKSIDFSWSFGLGYLTVRGIGIDVRYNLGISNINDEITAAGVNDLEINNRVWQLGLFYQFRH